MGLMNDLFPEDTSEWTKRDIANVWIGAIVAVVTFWLLIVLAGAFIIHA